MQEIEFKDIRVGDTVRGTDVADRVTESAEFVVEKVEGDRAWYDRSNEYKRFTAGDYDTWYLIERPKREIKVGDRVRRENPEGVTLEFVVYETSGGYISPKYGADPDQRLPGVVYDGSTFEVVEP